MNRICRHRQSPTSSSRSCLVMSGSRPVVRRQPVRSGPRQRCAPTARFEASAWPRRWNAQSRGECGAARFSTVVASCSRKRPRGRPRKDSVPPSARGQSITDLFGVVASEFFGWWKVLVRVRRLPWSSGLGGSIGHRRWRSFPGFTGSGLTAGRETPGRSAAKVEPRALGQNSLALYSTVYGTVPVLATRRSLSPRRSPGARIRAEGRAAECSAALARHPAWVAGRLRVLREVNPRPTVRLSDNYVEAVQIVARQIDIIL